jgi:succinate dehydrogenase/fumarate reductase-like Fe-S protein
MITVEIQGKFHHVLEGVTALQALWYTGHEMIRGIGCLGGVCGACTFTYRRNGEPGVKTGLACQTLVEQGMSFSPPVSITATRAKYHIQEIKEPEASLLKYYPETRRCTRCNACTLVCPQDIDVRACVLKALSGEFSAVSEMFYNCVMCGLCAAVCDVAIKPNLVALYARRSQAAQCSPRPENLLRRLQEVESGTYALDWQKILEKGGESLNEKDCVST